MVTKYIIKNNFLPTYDGVSSFGTLVRFNKLPSLSCMFKLKCIFYLLLIHLGLKLRSYPQLIESCTNIVVFSLEENFRVHNICLFIVCHSCFDLDSNFPRLVISLYFFHVYVYICWTGLI